MSPSNCVLIIYCCHGQAVMLQSNFIVYLQCQMFTNFTITRGNNSTLVKEKSRLYVRAFSKMTINVWNELSTDCVYASSVTKFKIKIDKYCI